MAVAARCFVAVLPPPPLVEAVTVIDRPARPGLRWTPAEQWHVTLRFLAAVDPDGLAAALSAGPEGELPGGQPVRARWGPRPGALGGGAWVLPVRGLDDLAATVARATAQLGVPPERRAFRGHLTLARARRPEALEGLARPELTGDWLVEEVVAYRSELDAAGARHHLLGRWPLRPRRPLRPQDSPGEVGFGP
ncbi:MAG: hypothetical protein KGQ66_19065 [Acidobacteriota bacterium]|nr:hypothetical protein [Acidobacteriota bacterium]